MTHDETIAPLEAWQPEGPGPHELALRAGGWQATLRAERCDALSCRLHEVRLERPSTGPATPEALTQWAVGLAGRITALLEPLAVHEIDAAEGLARLRSKTPQASGERLRYFELQLQGTHRATLHRYQASKTEAGRQAIPFAMTHEAIAQLLADAVG